MKRIIGFVLIVILVSFCASVYGATADTLDFPYKMMTGEDLVELLSADTGATLHIDFTRFTSRVTLMPRTTIRRPILLQKCLFEKDATFPACIFLGDVDFWGSTFSEDAYFCGSTFSGKADFWLNTFSGEADFRGSTFSGNVSFWASTFSGIADFRFSRLYCAVHDSAEPIPGRADFTNTQWANELHLQNIETRPGVRLDFAGAGWVALPITEYAAPKPVLYLEGANCDRLLFPVADEWIPRPLLGFGISHRASFRSGWRVQVPDPVGTEYPWEKVDWPFRQEETEWPVIQRTYGKFLTFLKESGRYDDYDALLTEFHDLETHYKWYRGEYLDSAFTFVMGLICGYGIRPVRAFWFSLWVVLGSTFIYLVFRKYVRPRYGTGEENAFQPPYFLCRKESLQRQYDPPRKLQDYRFSLSHLWPSDIELTRMAWWLIVWRIFVVLRGAWLIFWYLMNFVLFSVNTFCTVGYDNNYPVKGLRYVCMAELVLGYITLTLFLVSLVNILIR